MNERFFALSPQKQKDILDAGFRVFAQYGYKHSSTETIAREAGISKGLLFHYFENKKTFYLYLFEYATAFLLENLAYLHNYDETDFFKIIEDAQLKKMSIVYEHPALSQFVVQCYLEQDSEVAASINEDIQALTAPSVERILKRTNRSKFKESVSVEEAMDITIWMSEGYTKSLGPQALETVADLEEVNNRFLHYMEILRKHFYREEFL